MVTADSASFDANRRDPYSLNDHLQVLFSCILFPFFQESLAFLPMEEF